MSAKELWSKVAKTRQIDEETLALTDLALQMGVKPWWQLSVDQGRQQFNALAEANDSVPCDGTMKEMTIPGTAFQPAIPLIIHTPSKTFSANPLIILFIHGGGLMLGSSRAYSKPVQFLAEHSGAIVVNVDYRLLPNEEAPLCCFTDVMVAATWLLSNKEAVGGSKNSRVGLAGDSVGSQLACSVTRKIRDFAFQVFIYPVLDMNCSVPSCIEFQDIPIFSAKDMQKMFDVTLGGLPEAAKNPVVNPTANKDVSGSPPTLILSVELDPIIDWAVNYEGRLREAGVAVKMIVYKGLPHGVFSAMAGYPKGFRVMLADIVEFVKSFQ